MRINREEFLKQLESVLPGLSTKEIMEQSSCFIFQDKMVSTFNDEIACSMESVLNIEGAVTAMPLISILRKLKKDEIEVSVAEGQLLLRANQERVGINMEQDIVLPIGGVDKPGKWKKLPDDFADAIAIVQSCAGTDQTKFVLTCVSITSNWMEASNDHQVARFRIKTKVDKPLLMRKESLKHIVSLDMIEFSETKHWVHFRNSDGLIFSCRHWVDEFPSDDVSQVLKMTGEPLTLPKGLREAVEKAEIFSSENAEGDNVIVTLKKGKCKITGKGASGWFTAIKKSKYKGVSLQFTIPPKVLVELVQQCNECEVTEHRLKVKMGKFTYVTTLGMVGEKNDSAD